MKDNAHSHSFAWTKKGLRKSEWTNQKPKFYIVPLAPLEFDYRWKSNHALLAGQPLNSAVRKWKQLLWNNFSPIEISAQLTNKN